MNLQEVLRALQAKEINPEDAEEELIKIKTAPDQSSILHKNVLSERFEKEYRPPSADFKESVAIVGMSGRYPDSDNLDSYWNNLLHARNLIREIPESRWNINQYYDRRPSQKGKIYCKWVGLLDGIEYFDPLFFNISPIEAEGMDPQHRIFLQEGYKAFEDAGYCCQSLYNEKCGVYLGIMSNEYGMMLYRNKTTTNNITGNSHAIGAARISYFLNIKGPAIPVDTACSSSLVATHLACQALLNREIDMALVGGVSLYLTPESYIGMCASGMLSPDGQCKTFDNSANGFVPGEGVGALVLKRLKDAQSDNDSIYGVIIGSGVNHDGKTNGITAPSVNSQIELEREIYDKYQIHPESISYVEMHGTGTKLGDPIELEALSTVFKERTNQRNYCAIGSVKSNIGHTSAAAGVASIQKVLLCMKHKKLVPTLNFKEPNEHFNFEDSPFHVNTELRPWETKTGIPRRAGVSSFGFSGTNAHLVIEEYISEPDTVSPPIIINKNNPMLFILSAKSKKQLRTYVEVIKDFIELHKDLNLSDMAYTLQVGRKAMEFRLAFLADSRDTLLKILKEFIEGNSTGVHTGQAKKNIEWIRSFEADEDGVNLLQTWMQKKKLKEIAELWVNGLNIDWDKLYGNLKPRRISLPTYPFAREHYWMALENNKPGKNDTRVSIESAVPIHPLLQQNTSDLMEQRFTSVFNGQEFFLNDNFIKRQRILPGVAHLEMVREAINQAAGVLAEGNKRIQIKNVVWERPIVVGAQPVVVHIGLYPTDNEEIAYDIYSEPEEKTGESVVYSHGSVMMSSFGEVQTLDMKTLQAQCSRISSRQHHETFIAMGIECEPAHQGIEQVYKERDLVLVKLSLPSIITDTQTQFVLHPRLMELALQLSINLIRSDDTIPFGSTFPLKPVLPFYLQEIEILDNCTPIIWAVVRYSNGTMEKVQKFDIDLCDETGNVCVRMNGLEVQEHTETKISTSLESTCLEKSPKSALVSEAQEVFEMMTFKEVWQEQSLLNASPADIKTLVCFLSNPENQLAIVEVIQNLSNQTKVIFISQSSTYKKQSEQNYSISRTDENTYQEAFKSIREDNSNVDAILYLWALEDRSCVEDYSCIINILKAINSVKLKTGRFLLTSQFENGLDRCFQESWIGFERSLGFVLPDTQVGVIFQEAGRQNSGVTIKDWMKKLWAELHTLRVQSILYRNGKRHVCRIQPTTIQSGKNFLKSGGTYLITGGCGGLGFIFAEYFAKTKAVNLILTGRTSLNEEKQSKIKALEDLGSRILYVEASVSDQTGMKEGLNKAKKRFGGINGVIHAAGIVSNQSIFEKDIESFQKVLDSKIRGTIVLDEVLNEEPLDFICYFSSSSAILGDFGSCDYAVGNRFQMSYAHYRNSQQRQGQRQGKAFVINWPLWKDGGMGFVDNENSKMYLKSSGQRFLETEEGVIMFDHILAQNNTQHLILVGQPSRVYTFLGLTHDILSKLSPVIPGFSGKGRRAEMKGLTLEQCLEWDLKEHVSKLLRIPRDNLYSQENLADFGFDSISLAHFASLLTDYYGIEITPAVFFGYSTLEKLTKYFLIEHQEAIREFYQETDTEKTILQSAQSAAITSKRQKGKKRFAVRKVPHNVPEPIAIIGMSGRFPQAQNIHEMWRILFEGEDAVKEIPCERFEWKQYFGDPVKEPGKTNCKWCGCIPGVSEFDPLFFEISPKEAEMIDPRQRLLLQEGWKALEDAGYGTGHIINHKIGMFVGVEQGDYQQLAKDMESITSNHNGILAARLAYFLNLSGPVMAIDTACSSGLVAAHQACWSLRNYECDTAIAAGVNLILAPDVYIAMSQAGMLSPEGKCFAFDQRANGLVPGEAVAVVVLKRLTQAKADGDPIYGVIQGSGVNYDGKTNGITAPSGVSQINLLKSVYDQYNINPEDIEYIVAHGTGTKLGDPVEINALNEAFKDYTKKQGYCALTSTKTNFGHTFAASGLVSLISLVQAINYKTIPASLHCEQENDYIHWQDSPFYVNKTSKPWPERDGKGRTGAVSAFGMSGTNVHMVVKSYSLEDSCTTQELPLFYLFAISAKTQEALQEKIQDMIDLLQNNTLQEQDLFQISCTLLEGRQHFNHRCAIVIQDREDALYVLRQVNGKEKLPNLFQGKVSRGFIGQKAIQEYVQNILREIGSLQQNSFKYKEILSTLADFYCQGYDIPCNLLFGDTKPFRIHLPTYPFAKKHYWISNIHHLLHQNTSNSMQNRLSSKRLTGELGLVGSTQRTMILEPCWREQETAYNAIVPTFVKHIVVACEISEYFPESIAKNGVQFINMESKQKDINVRFQIYTTQLFNEIKTILRNKPKSKVLIQIVVFPQGEQQVFSALSGMLKTVELENPNIIGQLIELAFEEDCEEIAEKLEENSCRPFNKHIRYESGKRFIADWNELEVSQKAVSKPPWKDGGTYLITGGAGNLGLIVAKDIVNKVNNVSIIIANRSPLNEEKQVRLNELQALGARIIYRQVDITKQEEVIDLIQNILDNNGDLNGIIHSAGVIRDNFIIKKTNSEFLEVLAPKVTGLVNLDLASKDLNLDFFVLFSSIAGSLGNPGQADYATANAFMDSYAKYRNVLVDSKQRHGQTLSINWPLWKEGGMQVDEETETIMMQDLGMIPMQTSTGIKAIYQGLTSGKTQVMVLEGNLEQITSNLLKDKPEETSVLKELNKQVPKNSSQVDLRLLKGKTLHHLKILFGEITKLDVDQIDSREPLESYGINSTMIIKLNQKLTGIFGEFSKTLFYEFQNLEELADYFITGYSEECVRWTGFADHLLLSGVPPMGMSRVRQSGMSNDGQFPILTSLKKRRNENKTREPIAVIGMTGRYPQAKNLKDFWNNLKSGKNCITEIPQERWSLEGFYQPDAQQAVVQGKSYSKWGGFIEGFADFDPLFFNISPRETFNMDPQERLFIESCWEVLEDAGYTKERLEVQFNRRVGVFVGITKTGFELYGPDLWKQGEKIYPYTSFSSVANRISYLFNLQGPSIPIDTMCSSSLTAIHEACEHLYQRDCEMAIAGGVNLYLHPSSYIRLCSQRMLSVDGQCKSFGQGGTGFVPGEGVGVVLLKRLSQAMADEDHIYAVIRGTSINHGGRTHGYTVPNPTAQADLIRTALDKAGIDARTVSYIEAHGTGTELGDPIEITALTQAFQKDTHDTGFCAIGSIKSNIGHLEAAAGIAGVTKTILQMKHQKIVPSLHAKEVNSNIDFSKTPFIVQQEIGEWKRPVVESNGEIKEYPRIAGISSFGAGGSNAHIVIEEYIPVDRDKPRSITSGRNYIIIVLSGRNKKQLKGQVQQLLNFVKEEQLQNFSLADTAYTLQVGREAMEERLAVVVSSKKELVEKLNDFLQGLDGIEDTYQDKVQSNKESLAAIESDEEKQNAIEKWIKCGKYGKLLELWVKGLNFDWDKLYGDIKPRRISLPTYPFARKRYWMPNVETKSGKLSEISLQPLFGDRINKRINQTPQLITLSSTNISLSQPGSNDKAESVEKDILPESLYEELVTSFAKVLYMKHNEVDMNKTFTDMGLDSVIGVEWINTVNRQYGTSIPATKIYDYPTICDFAGFLARELNMPSHQTSVKRGFSIPRILTPVSNGVQLSDNSVPGNSMQDDISVEALKQELVTSFAKVLYMKHDEVDMNKSFTDMGLDSVIAVEWIDAVNKQYGTSISATRIYDYSNIHEFAGFLEIELNNQREGVMRASSKSSPPLSIDEVLERVYQGSLEVGQGYQMIYQLDLYDNNQYMSKIGEEEK